MKLRIQLRKSESRIHKIKNEINNENLELLMFVAASEGRLIHPAALVSVSGNQQARMFWRNELLAGFQKRK